MYNKTVLLRDRKRRTARAPPQPPKVSKVSNQFFVQNFFCPKLFCPKLFVQNFFWGGGRAGVGGGGGPGPGSNTSNSLWDRTPPPLWTDIQSENITFARFAKRAVKKCKISPNRAGCKPFTCENITLLRCSVFL